MTMTVAAALLSSARRYRGVSGRALARQSASSQAGLVELEHGLRDATSDRLDRILRTLGYQVAVLPTRLSTAASAAEDARVQVQRGDLDAAVRVVLQLASDLQAADAALRVALCVTPPAPTGDVRLDALLAGVVDHELSRDELPLPGWVEEDSRVLSTPWDVEPVPSLRPQARRRTSAYLRRHGVYLDPRELVNG
jgi:hypothetical protein